uniref:Nuclear receptor 2C2-associated protein n=1 Tax=Nothobranchius furzeri TaxID=105023 RepID=A0A8C6PJV0_NOTFU
MANSLICSLTQSRVSSVLNRDVKQFGKKFMFDNNEETCWNSDQSMLSLTTELISILTPVCVFCFM